MKVSIFGLGYVGFTAACCIANDGHTVVGVDISETKVGDINCGRAPFEEPGLEDLMKKGLDAGLLSATQDTFEALKDAELAIVCVGTPSGADGAHDMRYIAEVTRQIAEALKQLPKANLTVAYRSTMRPGSIKNIICPIFSMILGDDFDDRIDIVYNPEFLREAQAINDYYHPSKIVVGTKDGKVNSHLSELNKDIDAELFYTDYESAELTKFVDNSWHAVKVAFANEIGRVCEKIGISATMVHKIFVSDTKLNISPYYTRPGGAFGGSCLPKDVRALQHIANDVGANTHLIDSLLRSNEAHKNHQFNNIMSHVVAGDSVLMVGLAFKADTDDLRESPNLDLARKLLSSHINLKIYDPALSPAKLRGQNLGYAYSHLPSLDKILISKEEAELHVWNLVVASNSSISKINLPDNQMIISTNTIK